MNGNDFMSWILRSPFHAILDKSIMLITVTGRKTAKKYTTPVGYYEQGGYLWVITSRDRSWWRNLQAGAEIKLLMKGKLVKGFADIDVDPVAVKDRMYEYVARVPQAAKPLGIRLENGKANAEDIIRTAKDRLFVRIKT